MMIIYLLIFWNIINIISIITNKIFGFEVGFTLAQQLFLSYIYIDSKRQPQKIVILYFFKIKNCYFPNTLIILSIIFRGGIYDNKV